MALPAFSPWLHWDNRLLSEQRHGPGVYVLGRFEEAPPNAVDPCDRRILLIAETHGQTLQKRWEQFHYSAFTGGSGHAGGWTFHRLYCNGPDAATPPWLYVSAAAVPTGTTDIQGFVQSVKNRMLAEYQDCFGLLPCCNLKGPIENVTESIAPKAIVSTPESPTVAAMQVPIVEPSTTFSRWCPWVQRESLEGIEAAGVYALACFDELPPLVNVIDECVVYIGETCDNSLAGRLWQFNRSAFLAKSGHSGGWSFSSRCIGKADQLYVSILPITTLQEPHRSAFIRYCERKLLWQYAVKWGRRPLCNSK